MNFIKINGIMLSREPTSVEQGKTKLKKENRTIDGTLVVDIIAIKNKVKVTWDYITSEDMARLQSAIAKSDFVEVEYNDSNGMMTINAESGDLTYTPHYDNRTSTVIWKGVSVEFVEV